MATILLIEDDEITQEMLTEMLGEKYKILKAKNSIEGLKLLKESQLDLVITDLMVPGLDSSLPTQENAFELITLLRLVDSKVKILVCSMLCYEPELKKKAITLGANDCLLKIESAEILHQTITNLLA